MIAPQTYSSYPTFGTSATKCQPVQVKYETGYIPGDVLPAEHLNWFLAGATSNITLASAGIVNLQQEMQTILCCAGQAPSSCLTCVDQVYNAMMYQINASAAQRAPTSHASSATTYGVGTADNYGHLKISDTYTEVLSACSGVAASQKALACVYAAAGGKAGVGNTAGCPLGTASAGVATTAARSDHVHPVSGLATTCLDGITSCPKLGYAGIYSGFMETTDCGFVPACIDATNGYGYLGVSGWPFREVHAKNFCGTLQGNATSATNADTVDNFHATGDYPYSLFRAVRQADSGAVGYGYWGGMVSLNIDGESKWWHILSMDWSGSDADATSWVSQFLLPTQQGGIPKYRFNANNGQTAISSSPWKNFITEDNIGSQTVACATSATRAGTLDIDGLTTNPIWHWSGQNGQPSWLWGSSDGVNMYVWNPANFSVNYASSAGSADIARSATCASCIAALEVNGWIGRCEFQTGCYCYAYNPNSYPILALIPIGTGGGCQACVIPAHSCVSAITSSATGSGIILRIQ